MVWYRSLPSILITISVPEDDGPPSIVAIDVARGTPPLHVQGVYEGVVRATNAHARASVRDNIQPRTITTFPVSKSLARSTANRARRLRRPGTVDG